MKIRNSQFVIDSTHQTIIPSNHQTISTSTYAKNRNFVSFISFIFVAANQNQDIKGIMEAIEEVRKPSKNEQKMAKESYRVLSSILPQLRTDSAEIEIEETKEKIVLPKRALQLLETVLKAMSEGKPISIVPIATEVTTQKAAELLGCSRPHLIKLLETGKINFTKVGKHRRIMFEDVVKFRQEMKQEQKKLLIEMMSSDEELGLYDS